MSDFNCRFCRTLFRDAPEILTVSPFCRGRSCGAGGERSSLGALSSRTRLGTCRPEATCTSCTSTPGHMSDAGHEEHRALIDAGREEPGDGCCLSYSCDTRRSATLYSCAFLKMCACSIRIKSRIRVGNSTSDSFCNFLAMCA